MENFKADLIEVLSDMIQAEFNTFGEGEKKLNNVLEMIEENLDGAILRQASFKRRDENNGKFCKDFCSVLEEIENAIWAEKETKAETRAQKLEEVKAQKEQKVKAQKEREERAQKLEEERAQKEQEEKAQRLEEVKATMTEKEFIMSCSIVKNQKIIKGFTEYQIFEAVRKYHNVSRDILNLNSDLFKAFERLADVIEVIINQ